MCHKTIHIIKLNRFCKKENVLQLSFSLGNYCLKHDVVLNFNAQYLKTVLSFKMSCSDINKIMLNVIVQSLSCTKSFVRILVDCREIK